MISSFTNDPMSLEAKAGRFSKYHGIGRCSGQSWLEGVEEYLAGVSGEAMNHRYRERIYLRGLWRRIVKRANA